jgi:hypothetical protein
MLDVGRLRPIPFIGKELATMTRDKYSALKELTGYSFPVYVSSGTEARAQAIAVRCQRAYRFLDTTLNSNPKISVLILAPEDWEKFTGSPMFGVPQTVDTQTVVVAGQDSELWKMIVPPMEYLPPDQAHTINNVYKQADGSVSVAAYMDLLPVHEIGHLFIDQTANTFDFHLPRRWLIELFCNLCLHAYVANEEPAEMERLIAFPEAVLALGYSHLEHTNLNDFEQLYAGMEPPNFVWYLSQLHVAAHHIYDAGGIESVQAMFRTIVQSNDNVSDEQLAVQLRDDVHPNAATVLTMWPDLKF